MPTPLLTTKFFIPSPCPNLISRLHLHKRLESGLNSTFTLVSAPAGFGKTMLLSAWVQSHKRPAAWLSLDEDDNGRVRFLTYIIGALQTIDKSIGEDVLSSLQYLQPPSSESALVALINQIAVLPNQFILILDDYHVINTRSIDEALTFLIEHQPPNMHLRISTRVDPFLPLARFRSQGQMNEIRADDLRFSLKEAATYQNKNMKLDLSDGNLHSLNERTEGWITGLHLAALSLQEKEDPAAFISTFAGDHRNVADYLIDEVLAQRPRGTKDFLLQTSILDRMTGALCNAVTGQQDGQALLEQLEKANLFVVPLDDRRQWYRYHHLFADLLRQRLRQTHLEQIPTLHSRASEWYEQKDLPSDSIRYALAAEDFERAADLAELAWPAWSWSFQSIAWLGWVKALPDELVRARPVLSVAYAQALLNAGKLEAAEARLLDAERWLEPTTDMSERPEAPSTKMVVVDEEQFRSLPASLAIASTYHAQAIGDVPGTLKYTQRALDLLPEGDHLRRGQTTALLGLAYWASGDLEAAHRTFSDGLAGMQRAVSILDIINGAFVLADIKMVLGHLHEAVNTYEHALQLATEHGEPMPLGMEEVYTGISKLHRERGDLETAAQDLATGKKLGEQVELPDWQHRWCIAQARLKETLGELDGALDLLDEAERLFIRTPVPYFDDQNQ